MTILALLLTVIAAPASAAPIAADRIGIAAAVRGPVRAVAPGEPAAGRVVETGKPVFAKDHVVTGAESRLQILLRDETTFTLGPNSDMILDEFVFDPATGAGKVSAKMAKGVFRFVTGKVARRDPNSMKVTTPVGTIGIRGTMVAGQVGAENASIVLIGPGPGNNADEPPGGISVGNEQGSTNVDRSGYGVTVKKGEAPSPATAFTPAQLDAILGGLGSSPSGKGSDSAGGSTDKESGQDQAEGKQNSQDALSELEASEGDTSQFAAQAAGSSLRTIVNGVSDWDDVRSITFGTAQYNGTGSHSGPNGSGSLTMSLNVDFGNRTLGGGGSTINASGLTSATVTQFSYANLSGTTQSFNLIPFMSFTPGQFTSGTLTLTNKDGIAAQTATFTGTFNSGGSDNSGTVNASRP